MSTVKPYKLKSTAPDTLDELQSLHATAAQIEKARRELAQIEANMEAMRREHLKPLEERAEKLRAGIEGAREIIRGALLAQPKDHQKLLRGSVTYYIQAGRESVEVLNEEKALAEVKALGSAGLACVQVRESLIKAALKGLLKNPEAPRLEHVQLKTGAPTLAEKAT